MSGSRCSVVGCALRACGAAVNTFRSAAVRAASSCIYKRAFCPVNGRNHAFAAVAFAAFLLKKSQAAALASLLCSTSFASGRTASGNTAPEERADK